MSWRTLIISNTDRLSLKSNQLHVVKTDKSEINFSLDDLNCLVLENNYTLITTQILAKLVENNVYLIICNDKYEPTGIILSFNQHWKPLEIFEKQINMSNDFKKFLWKAIIKKKISNSINVLKMINADESAISMLQNFDATVQNNDITNREGLAAKVFFREIYGSSFIRFSDDAINNALNYGYKILASCIARTLTKYGLHCFLGIFHRGKTNNWNLAYDLIEPFRPLVDLWVRSNMEYLIDTNLSYNQRLELINLLNQNVMIEGKVNTIINAIEIMVRSFVTSLKENSHMKIKLPTLIELKNNEENWEE